MEKKIRFNFKKIFAILSLIVLLQNYGLILGNLAIAVENKMFDLTVSGNSDFEQMINGNKENNQVNETTRTRRVRRK